MADARNGGEGAVRSGGQPVSSATSGLAIIELATARMILQHELPSATAIELSPATGTLVVVVDSGLQRWSMKGTLLESHDVDWHPRRLFLSSTGDQLWCAGYSELSHYEVRWQAALPSEVVSDR